jgi:ribose/xylose/arabinose/galactoside ABC-type transport system permease subunit
MELAPPRKGFHLRLRLILAFVVTPAASWIWGFLAVAAGLPRMVIPLGDAVLALRITTWADTSPSPGPS